MLDLSMQIADLSVSVTSNDPRVGEWMQRYGVILPREVKHPGLTLHVEWGWGKPFTDFNVDIVKHEHQIVYHRGDYEIVVDSGYQSAIIRVYNALALKHALMNLYSAVIVHRGWGLLIHSSCVVWNDGAYIFAGHSGAGKSTVACLSSPKPLLSDEATIVRVSEEGITVYNSPFRSDTMPNLAPEPCPLRAVHIIHQAPYVARTVKKKTDAINDLLDKAFFWAHDALDTVKILRLYEKLIANVPVYDLYFKKDNSFWEAIS